MHDEETRTSLSEEVGIKMEDPDSEWKIGLECCEKDESSHVVKRILTNGYVIGRDMVITGIVISSAPLIVPPLVVFSVMGVAVSVPFGVLFASYSCTNKLMNMLLMSTPPPPPMLLEYYDTDEYRFEQEKDEVRVDCKLGFDDCEDGAEIEGYVADKEDNEQVEDHAKNQWVIETEIGSGLGLDDDYRKEGETLISKNMEMEDDHVLQREREEIEVVKIGVEMRPSFGDAAGEDGDRGYEEDVGDDGSLESPLVESRNYEEDESNAYEDAKLRGEGTVDDTVEDDCIVGESASNVVFGDVKDVETNEPVTSESASNIVFENLENVGTTASDVVFGDVKNVGTTEPVIGEVASSSVVFGDDKDVETAKPVTVIEIGSEKLVEKGSKNDEPVGEMRHVVILSDGDDNNFNSRVVDELDLVAREVIGDANEDERKIESDEKVLRESMGTQEKNGGDASKDEGEDTIMKTLIEEHLNHSINVDAREIGEENLLDERNTNNNLESLEEVGNEVKENAAGGIVDELARDNAKATYKKMPSRLEEINLDEGKIWEKIAAMRRIVGYKAPSQPTCIGELKALYVFTGVEPPASFEGDSDLDAKLKFLMAIVGVK